MFWGCFSVKAGDVCCLVFIPCVLLTLGFCFCQAGQYTWSLSPQWLHGWHRCWLAVSEEIETLSRRASARSRRQQVPFWGKTADKKKDDQSQLNTPVSVANLLIVWSACRATSVMTGEQECLFHCEAHSSCLEHIPEHHPQFMKRGDIKHMEHVTKCAQPGPMVGTLNNWFSDRGKRAWREATNIIDDGWCKNITWFPATKRSESSLEIVAVLDIGMSPRE